MNRIILLISCILLAALFLTGCLRVDIGISIDEVHNSYLSYDISMDVSDVDPQYHEILKNALNNFGWMYQENYGFTASFKAETDKYILAMRKTAPNSSFPEAFSSLRDMLTDESITAFSMVDMALESFPRQDSFIIGAMLDVPKMIELSSAAELPADLQAQLNNALETSGGTITLTFPVSELASSSHDTVIRNSIAVMDVPFDFTQQAGFELRGSIVYSQSGTQTGTLNDTIEEISQFKTIVLIASGSAIALLLIILLVVLLRRRKEYW